MTQSASSGEDGTAIFVEQTEVFSGLLCPNNKAVWNVRVRLIIYKNKMKNLQGTYYQPEKNNSKFNKMTENSKTNIQCWLFGLDLVWVPILRTTSHFVKKQDLVWVSILCTASHCA